MDCIEKELSENRDVLQRKILGPMLFNIEISDQLNAVGKALPTGWRKDHDQNDSLLFVFGAIWWTTLKNRAWPPCRPVQQQCGEMVQKKKREVKLLQTKYKENFHF